MPVHLGFDVRVLRRGRRAGMAQHLLDNPQVLGFPVDQAFGPTLKEPGKVRSQVRFFKYVKDDGEP